MPFYNTVDEAILDALGLTKDEIAKYRDAFVTEDGIVVKARIGGGNREYYEEAIESLRQHPLYRSDEDWHTDRTYALFHFSMPESHRKMLKVFQIDGPDIQTELDARWAAKLQELRDTNLDDLLKRYPRLAEVFGAIKKVADKAAPGSD